MLFKWKTEFQFFGTILCCLWSDYEIKKTNLWIVRNCLGKDTLSKTVKCAWGCNLLDTEKLVVIFKAMAIML